MKGAAWGLALASVVAGCAPRVQTPLPDLPDPTGREWTRLREHIAIARGAAPTRAYVEQVTIAIREPRTGKVFQARGAVAIDPERALRMILVGPGGVTALDAWVTDDRFRLVVPAVDFTRRGAGVEDARGLPVGFFRWWLLHPLDGRVLAAWDRDGTPLYLIRRDGDTITLRDTRTHDNRRHVFAARRSEGDLERLEWVGRSIARPHPGDKARYVDGASGLEVEVRVDGVNPRAPDPDAFDDPDANDAASHRGRAL